jgi:hypothetical protein
MALFRDGPISLRATLIQSSVLVARVERWAVIGGKKRGIDIFGKGRVSERCFAPSPTINGSSLNVILSDAEVIVVLKNFCVDLLIGDNICSGRRTQLNGVHGKVTGFEEGAGASSQARGGPRPMREPLEDAVTFIASVKLRRQTWPCWDRCAREILKAARTGNRADIAEATRL